ncbi:MAG: hypothetical protein DMG07_26730 [Acidobacteria bacterium]|nr:MAG: hypothetical protein DMG07_26730 [Acidobacteriota bacterium]
MKLAAGEFHAFEGSGRRFVYLVPSAAVFALDGPAEAILDSIGSRPRTREEIVSELARRLPKSSRLRSRS